MIRLIKESLSDEELFEITKEFSSIDAMHKDFIDDLNDDITNFEEDTKYEKYISRLNEIIMYGCKKAVVPSLMYRDDGVEYYNKFFHDIYALFEEYGLWEYALDFLKRHVHAADIVMNESNVQHYISQIAYETLASKFYNLIK